MTDEIKALKIMSKEMAQEKYMIEAATLRDQFAMAALTGMLSDPHGDPYQIVPKKAYQIADAMLEARKEKK
jgi:hypothetical protein